MTPASPPSRRDRRLPYTYEAWIDVLDGQATEPVWHHYFCDTLCGLIENLVEEGLSPEKVLLYGVFQKKMTLLDNTLLSDEQGRWLEKPALCRALEQHYERTHDERYRGHVEKDHCAFEDREGERLGPI